MQRGAEQWLKRRHQVAHHFDDLVQQHEAAALGMWAFLATEVMFFGGMFLGYTIYRFLFPAAFFEREQLSRHLARHHQYGGADLSSLTMVLAVHAAQTNRSRALFWLLLLTVALGALFSASNSPSIITNLPNTWCPAADFATRASTRATPRFSFLLLCHDCHARAAHDHRHRGLCRARREARRGRYSEPLSYAGRARRPVLALRRYHLDFSVSTILSARAPRMITIKTYLAVFAALLLLTAATTVAAFVDLGRWNLAAALAIAFAKAALVGLYFMHLRHSSRLILVFVAASLLWLSHMIVSSLSDYFTRNW